MHIEIPDLEIIQLFQGNVEEFRQQYKLYVVLEISTAFVSEKKRKIQYNVKKLPFYKVDNFSLTQVWEKNIAEMFRIIRSKSRYTEMLSKRIDLAALKYLYSKISPGIRCNFSMVLSTVRVVKPTRLRATNAIKRKRIRSRAYTLRVRRAATRYCNSRLKENSSSLSTNYYYIT